jgi:hypothetical protein
MPDDLTQARARRQVRALAETLTLKEDELVSLARIDFGAFLAFVMRDEETGKRIHVHKMHLDWYELCQRHDRVIIWAFMGSGKTVTLSVARTLFRLGRDPSLRFAIVSATSGMATKIANLIGRYIERSEELHAVFPYLQRDPAMPWNSEQITVMRPALSKDPSVNTLGCGSNIQGARIDEAILDDVLNRDNTRTPYMRAGVLDWYLKTIPGRMDPKRGRVIVIGNAFHPEDLLHTLVKNPAWKGYKFPILRQDGTSAWQERWPLDRIEKRRQELGPLESMSQLMCEALDDSTARFKRDWIEACKARGEGKSLVYALRAVPPGCKVYCGVDLGVGLKTSNDLTVFFVLFIHPNGDREVLWVESGRWTATDIMNKVVDLHARFHCIFVVENNGAQDFLVQILQRGNAIPILPFTTGANKAHPEWGVEAMGVQMAANPPKWIIPAQAGRSHPEVEAWIGEMLSYTPEAHTGDRLMASWLATEGERLGQAAPKPIIGTVRLGLSNW